MSPNAEQFTVILQRGIELAEFMEDEYEESQYFAHITYPKWENYVQIIKAAQKEAFEADKKNLRAQGCEAHFVNARFGLADYKVIAVIRGHVTPTIYSFSPEAQSCV